jgi:hypothetical protein
MKLFCRAGNVIAMRLRNFIALLGGAAVWPLAAHAQRRSRRPGFLFLSGLI